MTIAPDRDLSVLARPSGAFAMVALDQREALRAMFAEHQAAPVTDAQLSDFKLAAARTLSPYASGLLIDKQFGFDRVVDEGAVVSGCGLIAAGDHFVPGADEIVADAGIDRAVDPAEVEARGAVAMKLLVVHRPDGDPARRVALVEEFCARCRAAGLLSIIEPVTRPPRDDRPWDRDEGILAAAAELGSLGADLYKAEVPTGGRAAPDEVRRRCARITELVASPWVVLSSGVRPDDFPRAVELACREGASGFLAGRAVWRPVIGSGDIDRDLREVSVPRLRRLTEVADRAVGAAGGGTTTGRR